MIKIIEKITSKERYQRFAPVFFIIIFAIAGSVYLVASHAATTQTTSSGPGPGYVLIWAHAKEVSTIKSDSWLDDGQIVLNWGTIENNYQCTTTSPASCWNWTDDDG